MSPFSLVVTKQKVGYVGATDHPYNISVIVIGMAIYLHFVRTLWDRNIDRLWLRRGNKKCYYTASVLSLHLDRDSRHDLCMSNNGTTIITNGLEAYRMESQGYCNEVPSGYCSPIHNINIPRTRVAHSIDANQQIVHISSSALGGS